MDATQLRVSLKSLAPNLFSEISTIVQPWAAEVRENLDRRDKLRPAFPKTFTDPILGPIELFDWEVAFLDSRLLQRLRGVRQLGMAHLVYTSAVHDRLSHCLGVVEVSDRMLTALKKNALYRNRYGIESVNTVPEPSDSDRYSLRLASLLHDIGHGPFSHATESLIELRTTDELTELRDFLRKHFPGSGKISPSEAIAAIMLLSEPMREVFEHPNLAIPFPNKSWLPVVLTARILGSREYLDAPYLAAVLSGPIDADKLDYMVRDSYFTGLPLGLDVNRLISKLEVIIITPENAPDPRLRHRVQSEKDQRFFDIGLSLSGLTAYEQMIIGRVLLYDRVYYHHKVRCGEAMMRRLVSVAEEERQKRFNTSDLFTDITDDAMIYLLSGDMTIQAVPSGAQRAKILGTRLRTRRLYHRAFAFAERFIAGLDQLSREEERETRANLWLGVRRKFEEPDAYGKIVKQILKMAKEIGRNLERFQNISESVNEDHVLIDLPTDRAAVVTGTAVTGLFMRTEVGGLGEANLFFNPENWSKAYKNQKQCGYVYCPREYIELINLACRVVFFETFGLILTNVAHHVCKTHHLIASHVQSWIDQLVGQKVISTEAHNALTTSTPRLLPINADSIHPPEDWLLDAPCFCKRIAEEFAIALPTGLVDSLNKAVVDGINHMTFVLDTLEKQGVFVSDKKPDEKSELQSEILRVLRARGCKAIEGAKIAGGESDIILPGDIVLENKVAGETADPKKIKPDADWQARRYSLAVNRRVMFVLIAYKPKHEQDILPLHARISTYPIKEGVAGAVVRLLVPWGVSVPSKAKGKP